MLSEEVARLRVYAIIRGNAQDIVNSHQVREDLVFLQIIWTLGVLLVYCIVEGAISRPIWYHHTNPKKQSSENGENEDGVKSNISLKSFVSIFFRLLGLIWTFFRPKVLTIRMTTAAWLLDFVMVVYAIDMNGDYEKTEYGKGRPWLLSCLRAYLVLSGLVLLVFCVLRLVGSTSEAKRKKNIVWFVCVTTVLHLVPLTLISTLIISTKDRVINPYVEKEQTNQNGETSISDGETLISDEVPYRTSESEEDHSHSYTYYVFLWTISALYRYGVLLDTVLCGIQMSGGGTLDEIVQKGVDDKVWFFRKPRVEVSPE